jgi:FkbM family methyltransferase
MSFIKKTFDQLLRIYLSPVKASEKLFRYTKEVVLLDEGEHLNKAIRFLKFHNLLQQNPVTLDIGGADGSATAHFLENFPGCRGYVFEANPQMAEKVRERFQNKPVVVHNMALSDKPGNLIFHITDNAWSSSYKTIIKNEQFNIVKSVEVPADSLDNMARKEGLGSIDIIKLDVQGAELDVLNGGKETLAKTKLIVVEQTIRSTYQGGSEYYEVDNKLRELGFVLLDIITMYRKDGFVLNEFDSIYINRNLNLHLS